VSGLDFDRDFSRFNKDDEYISYDDDPKFKELHYYPNFKLEERNRKGFGNLTRLFRNTSIE
jgi:hypothetical protein